MSDKFNFCQYWKLPLPDVSEQIRPTSGSNIAPEKCKQPNSFRQYCLLSATTTQSILTDNPLPCPKGTDNEAFYKNQYSSGLIGASKIARLGSDVQQCTETGSKTITDSQKLLKESFLKDTGACGYHSVHSDNTAIKHEQHYCHNCNNNNAVTLEYQKTSPEDVNDCYKDKKNNSDLKQFGSIVPRNNQALVSRMGNKESRAQDQPTRERKGLARRNRRQSATENRFTSLPHNIETEINNEKNKDELNDAINELMCFDPSLQFDSTANGVKTNVTHNLASHESTEHQATSFQPCSTQKQICTKSKESDKMSSIKYLKDVMGQEQFSEKSLIGWLSSGSDRNDAVTKFVERVCDDMLKANLLVSSQTTNNHVLYSWKEKTQDKSASVLPNKIIQKDEANCDTTSSNFTTPRRRARRHRLQRNISQDISTEAENSHAVDPGPTSPMFVFDHQTFEIRESLDHDPDQINTQHSSKFCDATCQTRSQAFNTATQTPSVLQLMKAVQTSLKTSTCDVTCQTDTIELSSRDGSLSESNVSLNAQPSLKSTPATSVTSNINSVAHNIPPPPPVPPPPTIGVPPPPPVFVPGKPPPPPPIGINAPPPPPQPPEKNTVIEPLKPMKPLYWTRVKKIGNVLENTLWYSVPAAEVDHKELVHLFCKNTANKKKSTLSESLSPKKVKVKPAKLLSTKRSQALGIFISSLHMDVEDIKQAVLDLETNVVDVESISAIYDLRPQANELELIKSFAKKQSKVDDNDKQPLDKPEQFLLKLWEVDHCTDRLFCITFMHQFHCNLGHLQSSIALIDEVCKSLQQKSIQQLFGIILTIGNYLNAGNRSRGEAAGFGLDVLSKLKDVKGNTDNLNLLAYVLRVYIKTFDLNIEIALRKSPVPSTLEIVRASQIDYEDIDKAFQKLRKELKDCGHRVDVVKSNSTIHAEPFGTIMHQFLTKATSDVEELEEQISNSRRGFNDTLAYFGVKSTKSSNTKEFFDQWIRFCGDVNDLWHMQLKEILKAQKEQAKQKVEEIRSKTSSVVVRTRRRPRSLKTRLSAHIAADTIEP